MWFIPSMTIIAFPVQCYFDWHHVYDNSINLYFYIFFEMHTDIIKVVTVVKRMFVKSYILIIESKRKIFSLHFRIELYLLKFSPLIDITERKNDENQYVLINRRCIYRFFQRLNLIDFFYLWLNKKILIDRMQEHRRRCVMKRKKNIDERVKKHLYALLIGFFHWDMWRERENKWLESKNTLRSRNL
jgi:hypothetical protein